MRRRTLLLVAALVLALAAAQTRPLPYAIGVILTIVGQIVRLWASGHIAKSEWLAA